MCDVKLSVTFHFHSVFCVTVSELSSLAKIKEWRNRLTYYYIHCYK